MSNIAFGATVVALLYPLAFWGILEASPYKSSIARRAVALFLLPGTVFLEAASAFTDTATWRSTLILLGVAFGKHR